MKKLSNLFKVIVITLVLFATNTYASKSNSKISIFNAVASINSEWNNPAFSLGNLKQEEVNFSALSEQDKIKLHLQQVLNLLRSQTPANLTYAQKSNRNKNIDLLVGYMQNGVFPRNITHKNRIPFFVDDRDVPCAVGYLMLKAGYNEFVATTKAKSNNIYIKQINSDIFEQFKQESGFTLDELALIQPGYDPYIRIEKMIKENVQVQATIADTTNNILYIAGKLNGLNQQGITNLAKFSDNKWIPIPNEINGTFKTMTLINGDLYISGDYTLGENATPASLVCLSNNIWKAIPINGEIRVLYTNGDKLLIGGNFKNGDESNFAIYDKKLDLLETTNAKFNAPINSIAIYDGSIYVGGEFTLNDKFPHLYLSKKIADNWEAIYMERKDTVYSLYSGKVVEYPNTGENTLVIGYGCNEKLGNCDSLIYTYNSKVWKNITRRINLMGKTIQDVKQAKVSKIIYSDLYTSSRIGYISAVNMLGTTSNNKDTTLGVVFELDGWDPPRGNEFPFGITSINKIGKDYFVTSGEGQLYKSDLLISSVDFDNPYKDEITNISSNSNEFVFKFSEKAERNLSFKLFNLVGEEIMNYSEAMPNKDVLAVNKINLASGCYIANITKDNKVYNLKVLVKN